MRKDRNWKSTGKEDDYKEMINIYLRVYMCSSRNATYYGKTTRNLKVYCLEHVDFNRSGHKTNSSTQSSIVDHPGRIGHNATIEYFRIIAKNYNAFHLLICESFLVQKDRPNLGSQHSSIPLVLF